MKIQARLLALCLLAVFGCAHANVPVPKDTVADPEELARNVPPPTPGCVSTMSPPDSTAYDIAPIVATQVPPQYPEQSKKAGVQGTVLLHVFIDPQGRLCWIRVVRGVSALTPSAIDAVKQYEFKPATHNGFPVGAWMDIPVEFKL